MDLLNLLEQLTAASGVSGSENSIASVAQELLTPYCDTVEQRQGNVIGILGERQSGKPHVLLDAHMDQVGFLVTAITEDGFVRVGNAGGLDCRFMPAQRVVIHGKQDVAGVICCMPPHLQNGEEHVLSVTELAIDTGYTKEELERLVEGLFLSICRLYRCNPILYAAVLWMTAAAWLPFSMLCF